MRLPFNGNYAINQSFNDPCCRASYAQYGMKGHNGIDYNLPTGTPVVAVTSGSVYVGNEPGGYGNYLFLTDDAGNQFVYGHLQKFLVTSGRVGEGQVIAYSNNTGNSSGPHLHFGYRPKGYNVNNGFLGYEDPAPLFKGGAMATITTEAVVAQCIAVTGRQPQNEEEKYYINKPANQENLDGFVTYWAGKSRIPELEKELAEAQAGSDVVPVTEQLYRKK